MPLESIWFMLVAFMLAMYVVLDGFDLGAGILHLFVARVEEDRRAVLGSIGPVWDGNEVWLIAAGGTLYFAFPRLYAAGFSGFYLPLMIVLWLLMFRGLSIELRNHVNSPVWKPFWDVAFSGSSLLLALVFGSALGNVLRGVPLTEQGIFFAPLFTNFRIGPPTGILDWYTIIVGITAVLALTLHGALWLALKTVGDVQRRATRAARYLWLPLFAGSVAATASSFIVQPLVEASFQHRPWGVAFPAMAAAGLLGAYAWNNLGRRRAAFVCSALFLFGMMATAIFSVYPAVLPALDPQHSLTIYDAATGAYGLRVGLYWWIPGMLLVALYFAFSYGHAGQIGYGSAQDQTQ